MVTERPDSPRHVTEDRGGRSLLGHPVGLVPLFNAELWERFSFYGLQVILAYYLYHEVTDGGLGIDQDTALGIAGAYGGLVYLSQMLGAWVADRVLPPRMLVLVSGILIGCGHLVLAFLAGLPGLVAGLAFIVLGTGGLKVNVTVMVSHLYAPRDARRDAGFSIYYMGISLGAFLGPLITGPLQVGFGFHTAFAAAAIGMALGLIAYVAGWKTLAARSHQVANPISRQGRGLACIAAAAVLVLVIGGIVGGVVTVGSIGPIVTSIVVLAALAYFTVMLASPKVGPPEKRNVARYVPVFLATLLFWTLLLQLFTTFAVYSEQRVDLSIGSLAIPPAYVVTAEGVFATLIAPVVAAVWTRLGNRQPRTEHKIALGLLVLGGAYLWYSGLSTSGGAVNNLGLVLCGMFLFAVAEIVVVPSAMSITTTLAPQRFPTQMMSLYYLTMAGGATLSGTISQAYSPGHESMFFLVIGLGTTAVVAGFLLALRVLDRNPSSRPTTRSPA